MTSNPPDTTTHTETKSSRLHYLDWLRVLLIFGVFLFHALHPFNTFDWHIKNAEQSDAITAIMLMIGPWGIPLFFLVAGTASMFALRRRSNRQYIKERVTRLLLPLIVGTILLTPFQRYLEAAHKELYQGSFLRFIPELLTFTTADPKVSPVEFARWGLHLWFLGFLFAYSLLALPIFRWFKRDAGQSLIVWLGRVVEKRGGILLFVLPLALGRILIQPFDPHPNGHGWLDFVYTFLFFISGYIIYADDRFLPAIRRDRWLLFGSGVVGLAIYLGLFAAHGEIVLTWSGSFVMPWSIILIFSYTLMGWGWALSVLNLARTRLNFSNNLLEYGNNTVMPFYLIHQPVIILISFFAVQWDVDILVKLLTIVIGSFTITLGLIELLIRPFKHVRVLFGMKPRRNREQGTKTAPV